MPSATDSTATVVTIGVFSSDLKANLNSCIGRLADWKIVRLLSDDDCRLRITSACRKNGLDLGYSLMPDVRWWDATSRNLPIFQSANLPMVRAPILPAGSVQSYAAFRTAGSPPMAMWRRRRAPARASRRGQHHARDAGLIRSLPSRHRRGRQAGRLRTRSVRQARPVARRRGVMRQRPARVRNFRDVSRWNATGRSDRKSDYNLRKSNNLQIFQSPEAPEAGNPAETDLV